MESLFCSSDSRLTTVDFRLAGQPEPRGRSTRTKPYAASRSSVARAPVSSRTCFGAARDIFVGARHAVPSCCFFHVTGGLAGDTSGLQPTAYSLQLFRTNCAFRVTCAAHPRQAHLHSSSLRLTACGCWMQPQPFCPASVVRPGRYDIGHNGLFSTEPHRTQDKIYLATGDHARAGWAAGSGKAHLSRQTISSSFILFAFGCLSAG